LSHRYQPSCPTVFLKSTLGFKGAHANKDWNAFSNRFEGLTYLDATKQKLDCKTSKNALPLKAKTTEK